MLLSSYNKAMDSLQTKRGSSLIRLVERIRYLEYEEIQKLLGSAADHPRPMIVTALHTGMRRGEIPEFALDGCRFQERQFPRPGIEERRRSVYSAQR